MGVVFEVRQTDYSDLWVTLKALNSKAFHPTQNVVPEGSLLLVRIVKATFVQSLSLLIKSTREPETLSPKS